MSTFVVVGVVVGDGSGVVECGGGVVVYVIVAAIVVAGW